MTLKRAFKYSLALHAVLLFLMAGSPTGCGGGGKGDSDSDGKDKKNGGGEKKQRIVEKPHVTKIDLVDPSEVGKGKKKPKYKDRDCGKYSWFGGVGLEESTSINGSKVVVNIYEGYPAYKAGVRVGDVLGNPDILKGPPGTRVKIMYSRDGKYYAVEVTREKICVEDN